MTMPTWPERSENLIQNFLAFLRAERCGAENTIDNYQREMRAFAHWLHRHGHPPALAAANRRQIKRYLRDLFAEGKKAVSVRRSLAVLRAFFDYLVNEERIKQNPARLVRSPKVAKPLPRALSLADIDKMVRTIEYTNLGRRAQERRAMNLRDRAIVLTLFASGLRASELCALNLSDLNLKAGFAKVWQGKGGKDAIVPLSPPAIAALKLYLRDARPQLASCESSTRVFLARHGECLTRVRLSQIISDLGQRALGRAIGPHHLRHGFATALLEGGADIADVQALCRHADISSTQIYLHTDTRYVRTNYEKSHPRAVIRKSRATVPERLQGSQPVKVYPAGLQPRSAQPRQISR